MPLNITGSGDAKAYISFKASIPAWIRSCEGGNEEFEWSDPALFDVHGLVMGWLLIDQNGRDWHPWPDLFTRPEKPSEMHQIGFQIDVTSNKMFGDEPTRQYSENTFGNLNLIQTLYNTCEQMDEFKEGKNPLVMITGSKPQKLGKGKTRIHEFEIKGWVDSGEKTVEKPKPTPAPKPKAQAEDEF